ncbi:ribonuclease G [Gilvimarinus sp. F26214L]|uniref:ribonuclease G n=1 Tax=Gilvimarinus sp. DZF01 TaxID=3461371 RepID=UPI0040461ABE
MSDEILVNVSPTETRVALVENGLVQDIYLERTRSKGLVGNIYKGKVARVLPGMQAAFVDIGLERAGFIHAGDFASNDAPAPENNGLDAPAVAGRRNGDQSATPTKDIRELVREGQTLLVQVTKDPISTKGARLSTQLSVSARNLVYMPFAHHVGISARIEDAAERERLRTMLEEALAEQGDRPAGGFILRTLAEGCCPEELRADIPFLFKLWVSVEEAIESARVPACVHEDLPLFMRTLRDLVNPRIEKVRVDSGEAYGQMCRFAQRYAPELLPKLEHYTGDRPLFDLNGVEDELERALDTQVPLKSGGYLIIEQTEAMTTVDVNTGAFVGHRNLEETIFKTNLEAATAIARQLRLRNLGGIIILDFIDMQDPEHQRQVLRTLEKAMESDRARTTITGVSELGLIEMTRKRTRESLGQVMCEPCVVCKGRGILKTAQTVCYEIFREILREARVYDNDKFLVLAAQSVIDCLLDEESTHVADLEAFVGRAIEFRVETIYNQEQYDIVLV